MYTRTCKHCGREFQSKARNTWYCDECKTWKCPTCGKEVVLSGSKLTKAFELGHHYCSHKCAHAARLKDPEYHEKLSEMGRKARANDSDETKALRSQRIRESLADPDVTARRKATNLERYGYETSFQNPETVKKAVDNAHTPEAKAKARQTLMERYGVENPFQLPGVNERAVANSTTSDALERRSQSPRRTLSERGDEIDAKRRVTNLERYGVEYPINTPQSHDLSAARRIEMGDRNREVILDCMAEHPDWGMRRISEETGISYAMVQYHNSHYNLGIPDQHRSSYEEVFEELLKERDVSYQREVYVGGKRFDFKVGNVLVEVDPWHFHNSTKSTLSKHAEPKSRTYQLEKSRVAWNEGYRCIHVFDWDDYGAVADLLLPREPIGARKCELVEVDSGDSADFFGSYHLQGAVGGLKWSYGLVVDGRIVSCMGFGLSRYRKDCEYELLRYCTVPGVRVQGGAGRVFKAFTGSHPGRIVSYCDRAKFDGSVYEGLGFRLDSPGRPSCHWYKPYTGEHITGSLLNQRGADALIGTHDGKGTSNAVIMEREGWVAIYDCGQARYIYE